MNIKPGRRFNSGQKSQGHLSNLSGAGRKRGGTESGIKWGVVVQRKYNRAKLHS